VSGDSPRLLELRRRVQADPASIAFAQLAEECRRSGENDEAVGICRAGLVHHPDYLSARVTLGRALLELGRLDEAVAELNVVLASAPDNLPANRALAEVYQKRGQMTEALAQYKRALELAKFDPDIESEVQRIENVVSPPPPLPRQEAPPAAIEDLFDFDTLLEQLGGRTQPKPDFPPPPPQPAMPSILEKVSLTADADDPFSRLEQQLRETEQKVYVAAPSEEELHERRVLADLEDWLAAIVTDRNHRLSA
jgi:tetratricopeptide (TPR) repeat protein